MCRVYGSLSENAAVGVRIFYPAHITSDTLECRVSHAPASRALVPSFRSASHYDVFVMHCRLDRRCSYDKVRADGCCQCQTKPISPVVLSFIASASIREL